MVQLTTFLAIKIFISYLFHIELILNNSILGIFVIKICYFFILVWNEIIIFSKQVIESVNN